MLLVEKVDSYSAFTTAVNEAMSEKLYDKMAQEGFVEELEQMRQIKESFAAINEKCQCQKGAVEDPEELDEDDDEDEEEDEEEDDDYSDDDDSDSDDNNSDNDDSSDDE